MSAVVTLALLGSGAFCLGLGTRSWAWLYAGLLQMVAALVMVFVFAR